MEDLKNETIIPEEDVVEQTETTLVPSTPPSIDDEEQRMKKSYKGIAVCAVIAFLIPLIAFIPPKKNIREEIAGTEDCFRRTWNVVEYMSQRLSDTTAAISSIQQARLSIEEQEKYLKEVVERKKTRRTFTVNGCEFTMIKVQGGTFKMGSNNGSDDESPVHRVTLSSYYIGETEVTNELWNAVMNNSSGSDYPKTYVDWNSCLSFVRKLNAKTGLMFSLPTEAQWEYAARGGNRSKGYKYSGSNTCSSVANCVEYSFWGELLGYSNSVDYVGSHSSNELGIYDMSGNVWEWCLDDYRVYSSADAVDPMKNMMSKKVIRGGGFENTPDQCRSTYRGSREMDDASADNIGFRLVLNE